jgi:hypothetical protein
MKLYTTAELSTIIVNSADLYDLQDIIDYVFQNAVNIIQNNGACYYNALVFTIQEKLRSLETISI